MSRRGGRAWRTVRAKFRTQCERDDRTCWLCGQDIDYALPTDEPESWAPDHFHPVNTHPQLEFDIANLRPSHRLCNANRGARAPITAVFVTSRRW